MPRYFFHLLHPDSDPVRDDEGILFEDDTAAKREGIISLGELIQAATSSTPMPYCVSVQIVREGVGITDFLTARLSAEAQP